MSPMDTIPAEQVKTLRDQTGAGMMECKNALKEASGDLEKAVKLLRERGAASAARKSTRETREGRVGSYIHAGGKIGVLVELSCETDFVARTPQFQELLDEIAMQIAATSPTYISREEVPAEKVAEEREILEKQVDPKKPPQIREKIVAGKLTSFYEQVCLLDQIYIRDSKKRIQDILTEKIATIKENIRIRRFARFVLGE